MTAPPKFNTYQPPLPGSNVSLTVGGVRGTAMGGGPGGGVGGVGGGGAAHAPTSGPYVTTAAGAYTLNSVTSGATGISLTEKIMNIEAALNEINKKLLILIPDPAKVQKYQALQAAYDEFKLLEALLFEE